MDKTRYSKIVKKTLGLFLVLILVLVVGFFAGQTYERSSKIYDFYIPSMFNGRQVDFSTIKNVWDIIHSEYVNEDDINDEALIYGAIRGMISELGDPYSMFFDKEETARFIDSVSGKFNGVGVEITKRDEKLVVISPLKDSPALRAGIRAGDKVVSIDGKATAGITLEEAAFKIRGPRGTKVVLTIEREGLDKELDISIVRDTIEVPTIIWELLDDNIAYIEITQFSENTSGDFKTAVQEILATPADEIILDLRNNPGGFLDVSVDIAGWFIPEGETVVTEKRNQNGTLVHKSEGPGLLRDFSIVILQNEGSASASEILAGALRDQKNVPIVGKKSFGKGSVQAFKDLPGGSSIKITIASWVTPSGQHINRGGLEPTFEVELSEQNIVNKVDPQKQKAIEVIKSMR